ncbi:MAG: putative quinol monooxygenase [Novosphingobium sp.]|uniref:putative quinol monooxygenase n=1 Tax=Novosphingobium sp. TaxID=1874826 RepID=UPI0032B86E14
MPVAVIGQFRFPPEAVEQARPVMRRVIEATRAEAGCVEYNYAEDVLDPGLIRVSEIWNSAEQLAAHMQTPHMARWQQERAELGLSERAITVYAVSGAEPL